MRASCLTIGKCPAPNPNQHLRDWKPHMRDSVSVGFTPMLGTKRGPRLMTLDLFEVPALSNAKTPWTSSRSPHCPGQKRSGPLRGPLPTKKAACKGGPFRWLGNKQSKCPPGRAGEISQQIRRRLSPLRLWRERQYFERPSRRAERQAYISPWSLNTYDGEAPTRAPPPRLRRPPVRFRDHAAKRSQAGSLTARCGIRGSNGQHLNEQGAGLPSERHLRDE